MEKIIKITLQESIDRVAISKMLNEAFCGFASIAHHYTQKEHPAFTAVQIKYDCNGITRSDIESVFERRNIVIEKSEDLGLFKQQPEQTTWDGLNEKAYMQFQQ